ncbi:MAG: ArsA family ATPase [Candidatus Binatia bacterium]
MTATSLAVLLREKRLLVLVGEGGVGKTSAAAALAYARAAQGEDVAVLTIDPAPRLGDALGIAAIDEEPRNVDLGAFAMPEESATAGGRGPGRLTAMRLDSKRTFDRMVERHSPSPQAAAALLTHPIYRAVSGQLGGTENYMAFQRLHELVGAGGHDCLVVDTPPAVNASQLLAAPERLSGLVATGALAVLRDPATILGRAGTAASRLGAALARTTFSVLLAALERVTGASLQRDVAGFAALFGDIVGGLEDRSREIDALLRSDRTAFVLVTRPRRGDIENALAFRVELAELGIPVAAVLVNRVTPARSPRPAGEEARAELPEYLWRAIRRMEEDMEALRSAEGEALALLAAGLGEDGAPPVFTLAARDSDVASLADIADLARDLDRVRRSTLDGDAARRRRS